MDRSRSTFFGLGIFRRIVSLAAMAAMASMLAGPAFLHAHAQQPGNRGTAPLRIAIIFLGVHADEKTTAADIEQIVAANLERDRQLARIGTADHAETIADFDQMPKLADWRAINADVLLTGRVRRQDNERLTADFRLWDVASGLHLVGVRYIAAPDSQRLIAKVISNAVYERLIGRKGAFD